MNIVVVGAGIGGLSCAIDLAASGHSVTVVEAHSAPGGRMREHMVGELGVDSGPTVFTMRWVFDELFALAGTAMDQHLSLKHAEALARHIWRDGSSLDLYADVQQSADAIGQFAGQGEGRAYLKFAARSARVFETLDQTFMRREKPSMLSLPFVLGLGKLRRLIETRPWLSLWRQLGKDFADPRLRQLFARYATYCGSSPLQSPATLMLIAHAEREGVWMVEGGMQRFAEALVTVASSLGVECRFSTPAHALHAEGGRVKQVELKGGERLAVDALVYNGDVNALSKGLLGEAASMAVADRRDEPRSLSAFTLSVVIKKSTYPLKYHTVFFGDDYPGEFDALFDSMAVCDDPTIYICAQDRADGVPQGETERLFILMNAPARELSASEQLAYRELIIRSLERHGLTLAIQAEVVTSPNDFAARFPGTHGAIYGWPTHGANGSFRRAGSRAGLAGLYLAGGSVHPGPGIPMVALSGRIAAAAIRKDFGN